MLEPSYQRHVTNGFRWTKGIKEIADHGAVDANVFGFIRLPRPGADEDMTRPHVRERVHERRRVLKVCSDTDDAGLHRWVTRETSHLPPSVRQQYGGCPAHNPGCPCH